MTLAHKFQHDRSDRPGDLIFGIVISILLHLIVYLGYDNWLRFKPQQKRSSQPIPIEFIEVPPNPKTPPPQTKRIATNNSVAGGKSLPDKPVAARSAPSVVREQRGRGAEGQRGRGEISIQNPSWKVGRDGSRHRHATPLNAGNPRTGEAQLSAKSKIQNSLAERRAPLIAKLKSQKTQIAPSIPQPQPKPQKTDLARSIPQPQIKPRIDQPQFTPQPKLHPREDLLLPKSSSQLTTRTNRRISQPKSQPQTTTIARSIPPRKPLTRQVLPPKSTSQATKTTPEVFQRNNSPQNTSKIKSQTQSSRMSGAASRLGGTISVSRSNFKGYQAALANSNRFNQGADGVDARRDVDMGSYLMQLQQRVRQQWIPGQTQSSRRTVVHFVVSRSGQVRGLTIARPSGSSVTDSAALGAISRAAPFAPLPVGYPHNSINIRFTFNINVSGQLELGVR